MLLLQISQYEVRPTEVLLESGTQGASSLRTKFHVLSGANPLAIYVGY